MAKQAKEPKTAPTDPSEMSQRQKLAETYRMASRSDRWILLWTLGAAVIAGAAGFGLFLVLPGDGLIEWILAVAGGLMLALLAGLIVFGRRAQKAMYKQLEGQPGGGAAALRMLRRGWKVDPTIAFNKQQDMLHRVVGPPGIVLVGEGNPNRLRQLMVSERRKHERVAAEVPIHEVICGNGEGQVPVSKLARHVQKLGRNLKPAEMTDVLNRLKALDAQRSAIPLPKGPIPTSMKGMRGNLRGR